MITEDNFQAPDFNPNADETDTPREIQLLVKDADSGQRLDVWLASQVSTLSRKGVQRLCEAGRVKKRGKIVKKSELVLTDDDVVVQLDLQDHAVPAPDLHLDIVLVTSDVVVVNKRAGDPCAAVFGRNTGTVAGALVARYPEMAAVGFGPRDPGLLHRLDTFTSGLLVAARTQAAFLQLRAALEQQQWDKRYLAIIRAGKLPDRGECSLALAPDEKNQRKVKIDKQNGKPCLSTFTIQQRGKRFDLVEVRAKSAYRHQIRAHLAALGAPLIGDKTYGGEDCGLGPRHALHASYIAAPIAGFGELSCPLPNDLRALMVAG